MAEFPFFDQNEDDRDLGEAVRRATRTPLSKKFYSMAEAVPQDGGYVLTLDDRKLRTPARNLLLLPVIDLAKAVADEWNAQEKVIDPGSMPFTRIANSAIDGVSQKRSEVIDDLVRYAGSDLVCYRAEGPASLAEQQAAAWDPVLEWSERALNARFVSTVGIVHVEQSPVSISSLRGVVETLDSPFALAALHIMTTLSGSVLLSLFQVLGETTPASAWHAAHIDELFQESLWGADEQAVRRRDSRERDYRAASDVFRIILNR